MNMVICIFLIFGDWHECSCDSTNRLFLGQVGRYVVNGSSYEVVVTGRDVTIGVVQFTVNGEPVGFLGSDESFTLSDGSIFTLCEPAYAVFCINGVAGEEIIENCDQSFCTNEDDDSFLRGYQLACYEGRLYEFYDACQHSFELSERRCWPLSPYPGSYNVQCPNGCLDGACLPDDIDEDGILNVDDKCSETVLPESIPFKRLLKNRYSDIDADGVFETMTDGDIIDSGYSLADTYGCSCEQILEHKPGKNMGEKFFGCTESTIETWIDQANWARERE